MANHIQPSSNHVESAARKSSSASLQGDVPNPDRSARAAQLPDSEPSPRKSASRRFRWTSADIAVGAALGVACGLVFWLFNFA